MNPNIVNEQNKILYKQRNILFVICLLLLISNILFGIIGIAKNDKTIIVPVLSDTVSVEGKDRFSESYIEQMTFFYVDMLLDLTASNIDYKSQILLKHVDSRSYHSFVEHYVEEKQKYKKYKLATKFDITGLRIAKNGKEVEIKGVLSSIFGKESKDQKPATYIMGYSKINGRLMITTFNEKKDEKK